jgi:L-iditol 2-dehydrogenase
MLSLLPGDAVLVVGQGPIGLMFTRLLRLRKVRVIATDLIPERLELAREFGAAEALDPRQKNLENAVDGFTKGAGLDAAVIAVPANEAVLEAQKLLRGGGQVLLFAHTKRGEETSVDLSVVCVDEKQLMGSYSADFLLQKEVADLVFRRKLDARKLVTHAFSLEQTAEAIALAAHPGPGALKAVVTPTLKSRE